jgi:uracil phosphoribosyltransferase
VLDFHAQRLLNYFDAAQNGFISASRYHPNNDDSFEIIVEYQAIADFNDKYLLLVDPMLATGQSIIAVFNRLMERGVAKKFILPL